LPELATIHTTTKQAKVDELKAQLAALGVVETKRTRGPNKPKPETTGTRASPAVTHRGPNGEEWRGRGQKPKWLVALVAAGNKEDDYKV
jgi:DNA-binding protein H-NS